MRTALIIVAFTIGSSCTTVQLRATEQAVAATLISDEQESQLGLQVHQELQGQNVKFSDNVQLVAYVESLARRLTPHADRDRANVQWRWFVIDDPKTVNAFATPGGRVYVYTGLLLAADSEAEVIGVLGHELGHVVGRHSARQLVAAKGLETVAAMALGKDASDVALLAAALTGKGTMLAYGRGMELEADEYGVRYASGAGSDPKGLARFFTKLQQQQGDQPAFLTWLSTHPANSERVEKINAYIAANNLTGSDQGSATLNQVKALIPK